jgi:small nuclear ribonucleoprotein (snRNP)-like protein
MMDWTSWIKKRIFVRLKTGDCYTGVVIDTDNNFLFIIDKFGDTVGLALCDISKIKEESF